MPYFDDATNAAHAYRWAHGFYGDDLADRFVAYLQSLDDDEQERIADRGYSVVIDEFDAAVQASSGCPDCERSHGPHYTGLCTH